MEENVDIRVKRKIQVRIKVKIEEYNEIMEKRKEMESEMDERMSGLDMLEKNEKNIVEKKID